MYRALIIGIFALLVLDGCATARQSIVPQRLVIVTVADDGGSRIPPRGYHRPGYRISETAAIALAGLERDYGLTRVDGWPIGLLDVYCAVMAVDPDHDVDATLARISGDPRVHLAQPMQSFNVRGYDDPYFDAQYGAGSPQVLQMHQRSTGHGVLVAVIDTGMDRTHPDLKGRIATARNFVDNDARFDSDIHGTAVAGIIAADANNGIGIVGLAPGANLLALKACWQGAVDDIRAQCNTFTLAKALSFAIDQHADIINMSLGGPNDPLLALLIELALARGIEVVAADDATGEFPAGLAGVIAVRAIDRDDSPASADGPPDGPKNKVGGIVVEVDAHDLLSTSPGGHYDYFSGSSMGAARVAGLSALLRQERSSVTTDQIVKELDRRLAALGSRSTGPDTHLLTRAPAAAPGAPTAPASRAMTVGVLRAEGT